MTSLDEAVAAALLPPMLARIGADKAEHGLFDYDDMLQLVRDALHGPRGGELADAAARAHAVGDDRRVPGHRSGAVEHLPHGVDARRRRAG